MSYLTPLAAPVADAPDVKDIDAARLFFDIIEARRVVEARVYAMLTLSLNGSVLEELRHKFKTRATNAKHWMIRDRYLRKTLLSHVDNVLISDWARHVLSQEARPDVAKLKFGVLEQPDTLRAVRYHNGLIAALIARDSRGATRLLDDHLHLVEQSLRRHLTL